MVKRKSSQNNNNTSWKLSYLIFAFLLGVAVDHLFDSKLMVAWPTGANTNKKLSPASASASESTFTLSTTSNNHGGAVVSSASSSTFPLVLGDPSLVPSNLLVDEKLSRKTQNCHSYESGEQLSCFIEWDEWMLSMAFVKPGDVVMEFGARYGTTSCLLSKLVGPTGHVISVEPDISVQGYLGINGFRHQCGFHAVFGTVGATPLQISSNRGYGTMSVEATSLATSLPNIELSIIEQHIHSKVNVALIDCEGCIDSVDKAGVLDQIELIIMEEDSLPSYTEWHAKLSTKGFSCFWYIKDTTAPLTRAWSRDLRHSVWIKQTTDMEGRTRLTCKDYAAQKGLSADLLTCTECPVKSVS